MIIPNLMVSDMRRSVAFYRDVLGFQPLVMVAADRTVLPEDDGSGAVFTTLEWNGAQLMLQTAPSLAAELDVLSPEQRPTASGTIYLRGFDPATVLGKLAPEQIVKGPLTQWYGMRELYLKDPDGYILCLGVPGGPPPG